MTRQISINHARYTSQVYVSAFDMASHTGTLTVQYTVGTAAQGPGGTVFTPHPEAANATVASIPFPATAVVGDLLAALLAQIATQEGLTFSAQGGDDHIYDTAGNTLV